MTATTSGAAPGYVGRELWGAFIGGAFVEAADTETFAVMEPATGQQIARVVSGGADLVDRAVAEARRAYGPWRDTSPREQGRLLRLVAARIRAHAEELAELEAREVGKPRRDVLRLDVSFSHAGFDYYAGLADTLRGEILDQGPIEARVIYEPYGVVAAILPFNWPPIHFAKKMRAGPGGRQHRDRQAGGAGAAYRAAAGGTGERGAAAGCSERHPRNRRRASPVGAPEGGADHLHRGDGDR